METITNNEFLNSVLEAEAWKEVSQRESLSMEMLEKYADRLDWEEISGNQNINWTISGIGKFANRLDWEEFSRSCPENLISETTLQKYAGKWDWKQLSISEFEGAMEGVFSTSVCEATIDESPMAYKPTEEILNQIEPTVEVISMIRPKLNIKANGE